MRFSLHSVHDGVKDIIEIYNRAQRAEALGFEGIFFGKRVKSTVVGRDDQLM